MKVMILYKTFTYNKKLLQLLINSITELLLIYF